VVVPPAPGLFSSLGLLFADVEHHFVQTLWRDVPQRLDCQEVNRCLEAMEGEALAALRREGFPEGRVRLMGLADMRYQGQRFELSVPLTTLRLAPEDAVTLAEGFHQEHWRTFGYRSQEQVQLVNLRLIARGIPQEPRMPDSLASQAVQPGRSSRMAYFGPSHGWLETPVISREALPIESCPGPLIVEEYDATTVVPPGASARRDPRGNILIALEERKA
jgi:N-methylhydantoinase A